MTFAAEPDAVFEAERSRLLGLGYRMLGSVTDAEDVLQEAWLRWRTVDRDQIENPAAWLTTVTTRLAIDRLRLLERRRESYIGPWLPEPLVVDDDAGRQVELGESLTLAFLVLLDRLTPVERAVLLLADVFGQPFASVGDTVGKTPAACRQIAARARRKVRTSPSGIDSRAGDRVLIEQLVRAVESESSEEVLALVAPDVVLVTDSGAGRRAARRPIVGADRVSRFLASVGTFDRERIGSVTYVEANGAPSLVVRDADGTILRALQVDERGGRIVTIRVFMNPDKLGRLTHPVAMR